MVLCQGGIPNTTMPGVCSIDVYTCIYTYMYMYMYMYVYAHHNMHIPQTKQV